MLHATSVEIEIIFVVKLITGQNLQFLLLGNSCEHHGFNINCDFVQVKGLNEGVVSHRVLLCYI